MSITPEVSREPCPDRILDDCGGAFAMGAVGGSVVYFLRGVYHAPRGERFVHGVQTMRMNAPRTGGGFAVWGGLFSMFDCSMVFLRQKEDPWNSILAGAATGGFLNFRHGAGAISRNALFGGIFLALIEGAGIAFNKFTSGLQMHQMEYDAPAGIPGMPPMHKGQVQMEEEISQQSSSSSSSSWFWDRFRGGKKQEEVTSSGSKTEILESFDAPTPPTFEFK